MDQASTTAGRPDYYALLGVSADADEEAIRTAYRVLAKLHHPDVADGEKLESTERFLLVQEAYDVLRDADRRAQYDLERARQEGLEEARRWQRDFAYMQVPGPPSPAAIRPSAVSVARRRAAARHFFIPIVLLVAAVGLIVGQQRLKEAKQDQVTIVRVDDSRGSGSLVRPAEAFDQSADLRALAREMDELARQRAARVEAARTKVASQAAVPRPQPPEAAGRRVNCTGEGRSFSVTHEDSGISVSYNGGPQVRPVISDQGLGMVVVSKIEPTNRVSIGFMKGDKDRTIVLINDATGNLYRTIGVDCTAAVF